MANKYLEKIAALNPLAKQYAKKVISNLAGDTAKINKVYGATSGVLSKNMAGTLSSAEKAGVTGKIKAHADKVMGANTLYSGQAVRGARAGARLARMQARKVA